MLVIKEGGEAKPVPKPKAVAEKKAKVVCPECGAFNVVDLEHFHEGNPCSRCGTDLTAAAIPEPVTCLVCGEVCYNPCRKADQDPPGGEIGRCQVRVREPL